MASKYVSYPVVLKHQYFSRYYIKVRNSSIVAALVSSEPYNTLIYQKKDLWQCYSPTSKPSS